MNSIPAEKAFNLARSTEHLRRAIDNLAEYQQTGEASLDPENPGVSSPPNIQDSELIWRVMHLLSRLLWFKNELSQTSSREEPSVDFRRSTALKDPAGVASLSLADLQDVELAFMQAVEQSARASSPVKIVAKRLGAQLKSSQSSQSKFGYVSYKGFLCGRTKLPNAGVRGCALQVEAWFQPERPDEPTVVTGEIREDGGDEASEVEFEVYAESDDFEIDQWRQRVTFDPKRKSPILCFTVDDRGPEQEQHVIWIEAVHRGLNRHVQTIRLDLTASKPRRPKRRPKQRVKS